MRFGAQVGLISQAWPPRKIILDTIRHSLILRTSVFYQAVSQQHSLGGWTDSFQSANIWKRPVPNTNSTFTGHNDKTPRCCISTEVQTKWRGLHSAAKKAELRIVVQNIEDDLYCSQLNTSHCFKNFLFLPFCPRFSSSGQSPGFFSLCWLYLLSWFAVVTTVGI